MKMSSTLVETKEVFIFIDEHRLVETVSINYEDFNESFLLVLLRLVVAKWTFAVWFHA